MACEYCARSKSLEPTERTSLFDVSITAPENWVPTLTVGSAVFPRIYFPINYCPMCGEKLGDA